jgi:cell fate (sporulation/competence/biofilm development) regulator YlbF (YheA/YmcA/DUF963 family)
MSELLKEMCTLSGKLKKFIEETKDNKEKQKLLARYLDITEQIDKHGNKEFEENDDFYRDTIKKIKDTERLIKEFKDNQSELVHVFINLSDIIGNVEKILLGWKITNEKSA